MNISPIGGYKVNPRFGLSNEQKEFWNNFDFLKNCDEQNPTDLFTRLYKAIKENKDPSEVTRITIMLNLKIRSIRSKNELTDLLNHIKNTSKDDPIPETVDIALKERAQSLFGNWTHFANP